MKTLIGAVILTTCFMLSAAWAQSDAVIHAIDSGQKNPSPASSSVKDIPFPLRQMLLQGRQAYPEEYIYRVLSVVRRLGRNPNQIDAQDIKNLQDRNDEERRRVQVQQTLGYDANLDGQVTRDEIRDFFAKRAKSAEIIDNNLAEEIERIMRADANGDSVITLKEMGTLDPDRRERGNRFGGEDPAVLLALDPNKDNVLTVRELETMARAAFGALDADHDGILSREEMENINKDTRAEESILRATADCQVPSPGVDEKIIGLHVYEGRTVSTVSVAGQTEETDVIPVDIQKGSGKLYILTSSYIPVIWRFTGDTDRVSALVVTGAGVKDAITAGVTGIPANKIAFRSRALCGMEGAFESEDVNRKKFTDDALVKILGRKRDLSISVYNPLALTIRDAGVVVSGATAEQAATPAGYNQSLWSRHLSYMPGGVIDLSKEHVISGVPAEAYKVLPKWAGIAKLEHDGAIVAEGNGFKVVRNIPYFPAGLNGGYSTSFLVAKGVTPPQGGAGHSCVRIEETGEIRGIKEMCRF